LDRIGGGFLDRVGDPDQTRRSAVNGDEDNRLSVSTECLCPSGELACVDAELLEKLETPDRDGLAVDGPLNAPASERLERLCLGGFQPPLVGKLGDRRGERVLAPEFQARGEAG